MEEEHHHIWHVITGNIITTGDPATIRYCETCDVSFVLDMAYGVTYWRRIEDEQNVEK